MKYKKMWIRYNAYFKKKAVIHSHENISCISRVKLDVLCFLH